MRYAPIMILVILGCQDATPPKEKGPVAVSDAEAVELAKAYVLNNHPGAKILKVGPNLGRKEMAALRKEAGAEEPTTVPSLQLKADSIIRLKYLANGKEFDGIFRLHGKMVNTGPFGLTGLSTGIPNPYGDNWIAEYRKEWAKSLPGIKIR
jgi:hypothetical protein